MVHELQTSKTYTTLSVLHLLVTFSTRKVLSLEALSPCPLSNSN
uniref:Uncharacterized protein n=1 Tax=Setaria italica TaxID=4555 RepID=K3XTR0_SETIT